MPLLPNFIFLIISQNDISLFQKAKSKWPIAYSL